MVVAFCFSQKVIPGDFVVEKPKEVFGFALCFDFTSFYSVWLLFVAITFLMQSLAMVVPISALYESSCGGVFMSNAATFGGLKNLSAEGAVQV